MNKSLDERVSIDTINHLAIELFNKLDDIISYNSVYIALQFSKGNYQILPIEIAEGEVYKIPIEGSLDEDGYEKGLLYITKGSSIKPHVHTNDVEQYTLQEGTLSINGVPTDINRCYIGESHQIDPVDEPTIIKTLKISKNSITGNMPSYTDSTKKEDPTK